MSNADERLDRKAEDPTKKPYAAPVLTEYGTLEELTAGNDPAGMNDSGGPSSGKVK